MTLRPKTYALLAPLALLFACAHHPSDTPPPTDIDEIAFREHVRVLSADDFEGRAPGSHGEEKTVNYLTEQFRKLGLKPGNLQSFTQPMPLLEVSASAASLSVQGAKGNHRLEIGREAVLYGKGSDADPAVRQSDLVFAGYGIVAPEFSWNDYEGVDVHGKTVLVLLSDPGPAGGDPTLFKGNAMSGYGRFDYKIEEAARQGAAAVLMVHDPAVLGYGWNVVQNTWGRPLFKLPADATAHPALEGFVSGETARALFADTGFDYAKLTAAAAKPGFRAVLLNLKVDASLHNTVRPISSNNVAALLPGGKHHDEYIIFDAHWDSLGQDPKAAGHTIFNGAVDNATGVAGLLVLAKSFVRTDPKPDRSLLFLATTAAEPDHLGAAYYLKNPLFPLRQTAGVIAVETLLVGGHTRDVSIFGNGSSELEDSARAAALLQGRESHPDPFPGLGLYFRTDAYEFARNGIPALYVVSGIDNSARGPAYGRAQRQDFLAHYYRQTTDQYSAQWDLRGAVDDLSMYYDVGLRVARARRFPRWYPNSDYRPSHLAHQAPAQ